MPTLAIRPPVRISASFSPRDSFERRWDPLSVRHAFPTRTAQGCSRHHRSFYIPYHRAAENNPEFASISTWTVHGRKFRDSCLENWVNSKVTRLVVVSFAITEPIEREIERKYARLYAEFSTWSLIIARVQRVIRRGISLGMGRCLGVETSFPSKNSPRYSPPMYREGGG